MKTTVTISFILFQLCTFAQESINNLNKCKFVRIYTPSDYKGRSQKWGIEGAVREALFLKGFNFVGAHSNARAHSVNVERTWGGVEVESTKPKGNNLNTESDINPCFL